MELAVAMGIVLTAMIPLVVTMVREERQARALYQRAVAMEIVDGELEALVAGGHGEFEEGVSELFPKSRAATNLPPGKFQLRKSGDSLTLEWIPAKRGEGGVARRSARR